MGKDKNKKPDRFKLAVRFFIII